MVSIPVAARGGANYTLIGIEWVAPAHDATGKIATSIIINHASDPVGNWH